MDLPHSGTEFLAWRMHVYECRHIGQMPILVCNTYQETRRG